MSYRKKHISPKIRGLRKRTPLVQQPIFWIAVFAVIVFATIFYGLFFWSAIQVNAIEVQGESAVEAAVWETVNTPWVFLPQKNIFFIDTQKIEQHLKTQFPELAQANVQKKFFNKLVVVTEKRNAVAQFCNHQSQCFLIDREGVVFALENLENSPLATITKAQPQEVILGQSVIQPDIMHAIESIQKNLADRFSVTTKEVLLADTMVVTTNEHWKVYFDQSQELPEQITRLTTLLGETIKPAERKNLTYIYLQYKDRAYYK